MKKAALLAEFYPALQTYLRDAANAPLCLTMEDLPSLLFDALPAFRLLGVQVVMPKTLDKLLRPRLSLQVNGKTLDEGAAYLNLDDLFDFDWQIALGEQHLTAQQFEQLVLQAGQIIRFN
jgi:hypothetical protein